MNWINGNDRRPPVTKEGAFLSAKYKSKPFSIICLVADDGVLKWHWCEHTRMREFGGHRWIKDEEWGEMQWLDESQPEVIEAARELLDSKFWQYKSKNGRMMSIEDTSGEKCWIVPDEKIQRLQAAIESNQLAGGQSAGVWVKASDRLGKFIQSDIPEWSFFHPNFCKYNGKATERPFFRKDSEKNTIKFSFIYVPGTNFSQEVEQKDFHLIEWLDESLQPATTGEAKLLSKPIGSKWEVKCQKHGHRFQIGEIITIEDITNVDYRARNDYGQYWWLRDEELQPTSPDATERQEGEKP